MAKHRRRRKKVNARRQYGSGIDKLPYPTFAAPYYQRGYGLPEFWKRSIIPLWEKIRKPLSKALIFGGRVLHDQAHKGHSLSQAVGSNLPNLFGKADASNANIKTKSKLINSRRKGAVKKKRQASKTDIFS